MGILSTCSIDLCEVGTYTKQELVSAIKGWQYVRDELWSEYESRLTDEERGRV